jgi:phospholipase C
VKPPLDAKGGALRKRKFLAGGLAGIVAAAAVAVSLSMAGADTPEPATKTPIKHVVVIFGENISFDHYFGTYPYAANPPGEPKFVPAPGTPSAINLLDGGLGGPLLTDNPNELNPERLDRLQPITCDNNHDYTPEQEAFDRGLMDMFVQKTAGSNSATEPCPKPVVMDYYDGNTVTALWNYAQHYALNDNSFGTTFGPSTPGALNLISGNTHGASPEIPGVIENGTDIGDTDPAFDDCSSATTFKMEGPNIGTLMNSRGLTWGWFQGGFAPSSTTAEDKPVCGSSHANVAGATVSDYSAHHEPFQYYAATANPLHLPPSSSSEIGITEQANHQYDISDFKAALEAGVMPNVSFLKAPRYEDGHAGYSDPLDEQRFIVETINEIEHSKYWGSTAIVLAYDDSDGWYDQVMPPIVRDSASPADKISGEGKCGSHAEEEAASLGKSFQNDRCGFGPRLPLMVISPWAKQNYIDNTLTDQSSIIKFIEENWSLGTLGSQSSDAEAGTLENMFEWGAGKRASAIELSPVTGEPMADAVHGQLPMTNEPVGGHGTPEVVIGSNDAEVWSGEGSPSGGGSAGNDGKGAPASKAALHCSVGRRHHKVTIGCTTSGAGETHASLRVRLERAGKVYANQLVPVNGGQARLVVRPSRKLGKGSYTLLLAFDDTQLAQDGQVLAQRRTVTVG